MNILVCVKQVPDTTEIKIDPVTNTLIRNGVDYQIIIFLIKFTTKFEEEPHFPSGRRGLLFLYRQHKLA